MKTVPKEAVLLASGLLTWDVSERRSGRYGTVVLVNKDARSKPGLYNPEVIDHFAGSPGTLVAKVTSPYEGEYTTRKTQIGEIITFGTGILAKGDSWAGDGTELGVVPPSVYPWMNVEELYVAKDCVVELYFIPK